MKLDLSGKAAIVTGGSRGIGAAIALELAESGADVAINYRTSAEKAQGIVSRIEKAGRRALAVQADVASFQDAQNMVQTVVEAFGHLDILVNNAGLNRDAVVWKMTEADWDLVLDVDLKGCFNYTRAVAPLFKEQGHGKIVNLTSINGLRGKFGQTNYAAAKAGIIGLTKSAAKELGRFNVNVNAVAPGLIETEMIRKMPEEFKRASLEETAFHRLGRPEDVAAVVVFLCSEAARHITGEVIKVDGGQYI